MQIVEVMDRVCTIKREYCIALRNAGYSDLHIGKTHIAIEHFLEKMKLYSILIRMFDKVTWQKNENFH